MDVALLFVAVPLALFSVPSLIVSVVARRRLQERAFVRWRTTNPAAHANGVPPADWRVFACEWVALFSAVALGVSALGIVRFVLEQVRVL